MNTQTTLPRETGNARWLTGLDFLWLEITRKCNLKCIHCYADSSPHVPLTGSMEYEDWQGVLEESFTEGCKAVQFIGGEPTLHPRLTDLVRDARSIGYEFIEVYTNGTVLTDTMLDVFVQNQVRLAFSVYAPTDEGHDRITLRAGSFAKTMASIKKAVERGLAVRAGVIVMDANKSEVASTKALLKDLGVQEVGVDRVRGIGRGGDFSPSQDPFGELCGSCWKGKLRIDPDGLASPCVFSGFYCLGNAKEGLDPILDGDQLLNFRNRVHAQEARIARCMPHVCNPDTCRPAAGPCQPDCAPACSPCVPDIRR